MKKTAKLVLFFCFSMNIYSYTDLEIKELADEKVFDSVDVSFKDIPDSNRFIEKYSLTDQEVNMIGMWGFDGIVCKSPANRRYGPGLVIYFYPNRYFCAINENKDQGQIKSIFGIWKINNGKLLLNFKAKLIIIDCRNKKYHAEYLDDNIFYPIFIIPKYKLAFINDVAFDWKSIPSNIISYFGFHTDDAPRSRLLFDSLDPPVDIQKGTVLGELLFNPCLNEKYLIDLMYTWY